MLKVCFFGHRNIHKQNEVEKRLFDCLYGLIDRGANQFYMADKGDFDKISLSVCRMQKRERREMEIFFVQSSFKRLRRNKEGEALVDGWNDIKTIFFEVEDEYYKNKIIKQNRLMVDLCDIVVCYVDMKRKRSGAKRAVLYAKKNGKEIINLYDEADDIFFGLSEEEKKEMFKQYIKKD